MFHVEHSVTQRPCDIAAPTAIIYSNGVGPLCLWAPLQSIHYCPWNAVEALCQALDTEAPRETFSFTGRFCRAVGAAELLFHVGFSVDVVEHLC